MGHVSESVRLARALRRSVWIAVLTMSVLTPHISAGEPLTGAQALQELRSFRELGSVLYVAAHPDDENTQLIAYLARGRGLRTGYLSLTRGDGGQNALGPQFDEQLGVARTQELLAARRIDRGQQFFTRARDFGFSKDPAEALALWDRQQILADVVRVIRRFQPDVIITRFSADPAPTHGQHTASAILALEAFKLAGDPGAFPEQLQELRPWQPKRILHNRIGRGAVGADILQLDIAGTDPVTGEPFGTIAAQSLAMHKTQGLTLTSRGGGATGPRVEMFQLLAGEPMSKDFMDGIDVTWGRLSGGAEIGRLADELVARFDRNNLAANVPALLKLREKLVALLRVADAGPVLEEKRRQLDRIVQACLGLTIQTTVAQEEVVAGESLPLRHAVTITSPVPVVWTALRYPRVDRNLRLSLKLAAGKTAVRETTVTMPADSPLSQPYWLREEGTPGTFRASAASLIGLPQNPAEFPVEYTFEVGGQTLVVTDEPVRSATAAAEYEARRPVRVIAPATLRFVSGVELFAPSAARPIEVEIKAARGGLAGTLALEAPAGWKATPASQAFRGGSAGDTVRFKFTLTAPAKSAVARIGAALTIGGKRFDTERVDIHYPHIPFQLLQPPARLKVVSLDLAIRGRRVGYIAGAGDSVAEGIERMGYAVVPLDIADLGREGLPELDAVVVGVRAFNVRRELAERLPTLFDYAQRGGTVIVQYNTVDLPADSVAPYPLKISRDRVTDETAAITFLAPDHPALNVPNKITANDFEHWVQERGLYFANEWDARFTPLIACSDPGEQPLAGGLLVARHGEGYFVYTGLAFFRQIPAGVPGAYRLFANLIALGKR